jgi:hypothetical protein
MLAPSRSNWPGKQASGLGAEQAFQGEGDPFESLVHDIDAVIDLLGGKVQTRSFAVLKPGEVFDFRGIPARSDVRWRTASKPHFFS